MATATSQKIYFTAEDLAYFHAIGNAAYLPGNRTRLAETALAHEAFIRWLEELRPNLVESVSRDDGHAAHPLLRELLPAYDLVVNGWRVEVHIQPWYTDILYVERAFARSPAHPDFYVLLWLRTHNGALSVSFGGWAPHEQVMQEATTDKLDGVDFLCVKKLEKTGAGLLEALSVSRELRKLPEPDPELHFHVKRNAQKLKHLLTERPDEIEAEEYKHLLTCHICQEEVLGLLYATQLAGEAAHLLESGKYPEAQSLAEQALRRDPFNHQAMECYFQVLSGRVTREPTDAALWRNRGILSHIRDVFAVKPAISDLQQAYRHAQALALSLFRKTGTMILPRYAWTWAYPAATEAAPRLVIVDAEAPDRKLTYGLPSGPMIQSEDDQSFLGLDVPRLPVDLIGYHFRIFILSQELQTFLEQRCGRKGNDALRFVFSRQGAKQMPELSDAIESLAGVWDFEGSVIAGSPETGAHIQVWHPIGATPEDALNAKTVVIPIFKSQGNES